MADKTTYTSKQIFYSIRPTMADQLGMDEYDIKFNSNLQYDLIADSLDVLQILNDSADKFEVVIPNDIDHHTVKTVLDLIITIKTALGTTRWKESKRHKLIVNTFTKQPNLLPKIMGMFPDNIDGLHATIREAYDTSVDKDTLRAIMSGTDDSIKTKRLQELIQNTYELQPRYKKNGLPQRYKNR